MSTPHAQSQHQFQTPFRLGPGRLGVLMLLVAIGVVSLYLSFVQTPERAWFNVLIGSTFFLGLSLFGLFFTAIQHLTSAKWSVGFRRTMETMGLALPVAGLLFIPVYLGLHSIYEWTHLDVVAKDPLLQLKQPWLNEKGFGLRLVIYFVLWIGSIALLARNSFAQDKSGDPKLTLKNKALSALVIVVFAVTVTLAGFDILMSLEPHWFSTIFGVYFFAGFFQAGLCVLYILGRMLASSGALKELLTEDHFHDLTRFIFGFSIFWAYIGFSQYLLIWYANLPETNYLYLLREQNGWAWVGLALLATRFVIPFLGLMAFGAKRCAPWVYTMCAVILFGHWLDLYWFVKPTLRLMTGGEMPHALFTWTDLGSALGFLALFFLVTGLIMERVRNVAVRDPRLQESIHYYHGH